jgi:plasmid maintenance system antidote protein VapI
MHYGTRAKDWITDHDVKQKTLAKEFHVTEAMMSHYLTGRNEITVDVLVKFAKYFDLSMDYLVGLSDIPERQSALSKSEKQLIDGFRTLSAKQKELILQNVGFMQEQNRRQ